MVAGDRDDVLGDPRRRCVGRRDEGIAKTVGRVGEDKCPAACRGRLFKQVEGAGNVDVCEVLSAVTVDMRPVQRRGVEHDAIPSNELWGSGTA